MKPLPESTNSLINTGALARCKAAGPIWKVFQHFTAGCAIPGPFALGALMLLCGMGRALAGVHYVDVNSTNATPPHTNWATAATNIQDAVDAAVAWDEIVVTNGVPPAAVLPSQTCPMNRLEAAVTALARCSASPSPSNSSSVLPARM